MRTAPAHKLRCILMAAIAMALSFFPCSPVWAAAPPLTTVTVIGTAQVQEDGTDAAREKAITDALTAAVQIAAAGLLDDDGMVTHFPTLNQVLFDEPQQVVREYRVMAEFKHGSSFRVLVAATLEMPKVVEQMTGVGILKQSAFLPRVLCLISEQIPEGTPPRYGWSGDATGLQTTTGEAALTEALTQKGFPAILQDGGPLSMASGSVSGTPDLSNAQAAGIGAQLGADIVVTGTAASTEAMNTMGTDTRTFKGTVSVRAVRTETGEEIAATVQSAIATGTDDIQGGADAITAAAKTAAENLAGPLENAWQSSGVRPGMLEVTVKGTQNLAGFVRLRKMMSAAPGVNGIQVRSMGADQATIALAYPDGGTEELAAALIGNDFESFGIHISEITTAGIVMEIVSPEAALTPETTD